jgi:hypothetical protein
VNLNPRVDVPRKPGCETAFKQACARYPWLKVEYRGVGTHTGKGTSWAGAYDVYEIIDPLSPSFGMTGRVAEAADEIGLEVVFALGNNRDNGKWW